jgi:hypothetical protein
MTTIPHSSSSPSNNNGVNFPRVVEFLVTAVNLLHFHSQSSQAAALSSETCIACCSGLAIKAVPHQRFHFATMKKLLKTSFQVRIEHPFSYQRRATIFCIASATAAHARNSHASKIDKDFRSCICTYTLWNSSSQQRAARIEALQINKIS